MVLVKVELNDDYRAGTASPSLRLPLPALALPSVLLAALSVPQLRAGAGLVGPANE